jgi:hypothetical protein
MRKLVLLLGCVVLLLFSGALLVRFWLVSTICENVQQMIDGPAEDEIPDPAVPRSLYDRIKIGMSEREVLETMGTPPGGKSKWPIGGIFVHRYIAQGDKDFDSTSYREAADEPSFDLIEVLGERVIGRGMRWVGNSNELVVYFDLDKTLRRKALNFP